MKFEHQQRQNQNQTATFNKPHTHPYSSLDSHLRPIDEFPELEEVPQSHSIVLPQPLIHNQQHSNLRQFEPNPNQHPPASKQYNWSDPNLTFHPNLSSHLLYDDKPIHNLRQQQVKLKEQLRGLNQIVSEMLDKKYQLVNEYERVVKQKKCYKRLMKNLEDEYEGYQTMLQADYHIRLQEEVQASIKQFNQLKKQVTSLNLELSKPLIKDIQQSDMKLERLQKEVFQTEMFIQKQKVANIKKKEQLAELSSKIKEKQENLKKLNRRIIECEQQCEQQELLPQQSYKLLMEKFEQTKLKLLRYSKINEMGFKKKDLEYQRKAKDLGEKEILLDNINYQINHFSQKMRASEIQLQKLKAQQQATIKKSKHDQKGGLGVGKKVESRYFRTNTPQGFKEVQKIKRSGEHTTPFRSHQRRENDYTSINSKAHRTLTEPDDSQERLELSLRKKRIYTELEKNMYFKKIQYNENQKLSRILQGSDLIESHPSLQKQNSRKTAVKLPDIHLSKPKDSQPISESIIQQAMFSDVEQERKQKKKSIELHNKYIKQLKANRQALNRSNYQQLCNILNRDRLLIEQDCEYEIGDLIYNSKF